jgi:hypothetical protein
MPLGKEKNTMKQFWNLCRQTEFHLLLFFLGVVLFNWPFLAIFHSEQPQTTFICLFVLWGLGVVLLFFISRCCKKTGSDGSSTKDKDKDPPCLIRE